MLVIRRVEGHIAFVTKEQAAKIGIAQAFTVQLFCSNLPNKPDHEIGEGHFAYMLSEELDSHGHGIEVSADLGHIDKKIIDALGVCVADIHDYQENQYEEDEEYFYHFEKTNKMFIDLETGAAYNSDMTKACGFA